jgi:1,4-dihydroxy-2-naphthoate octaprenyltransferase
LVTAQATNKTKTGVSLKTWLLEPRPQFLILPIVLILLGTAAAWYYTGALNIVYALLALVGLLLCHASVNILNDYFDYKSGVDLKTIKTPFSGGSGILPAELMKPRQAWLYGLITFILAVPVGVYFVIVQGWQLLPLLVVGGVCILFYTTVILKIRFPEWSPGLGLGILPVLGAYFVQTGSYSLSAFIASIPSGLLVLNLLLLNEFPDVEADKIANKKTLPIIIGSRNSAIVYSFFMVLMYVCIIGSVIAGRMPVFTLIALLTVPVTYKAVRGAFSYNDLSKFVPAQANNVLTVLVTQALLGIGFILGGIFG